MATERRSALLAMFTLLAATCSPTAALPVAEPTPNAPGDPPSVDWGDSGRRVIFDIGWSIYACDGDAPLLCVEKDGRPVGVVEAMAHPIGSFPDLDTEESPQSTLRTFAAGFVDSLRRDRAEGCGPDYGFAPMAPQPITLGDTPGISFGYIGTMRDGSPSELNLQYAAVVGDQIVSIVAIAYDEGLPRSRRPEWVPIE